MTPAFEGVPEHIRELLPPEMSDIGGGKSVLALDDEMVDACREARGYIAGVARRAKALAENMKLNGATFDEAWAALIVVNRTLPRMRGEEGALMLAYLLAELTYPEEAQGETTGQA